MSRRMSSRTRIVRPILVGLLGLTACSPAARVYSVVPVDREGNAVDVARLDLILLDDGTRRTLLADEGLALVGQTFVIEGRPRADGTRPTESIAVDVVESVRQTASDGTEHWIEVRTPRDLDEFNTLPRIQRIDTADGRRVDFDRESGQSARWSADRLAIVIDREGGDEPESIPLESIARIELFAPDLVGSTLASPAFWIVGAVATGLVIWLADAEDEESLATR